LPLVDAARKLSGVVTKTEDSRDLTAALDFGRVPVNRHFGFSLLALEHGAAEVAMPLKRRGKRVAPAQVEVFQARRLVGTGLFTYLVYRRDEEGG
jgi:acyl-coenzyme A thioesterase PaaI-like protein